MARSVVSPPFDKKRVGLVIHYPYRFGQRLVAGIVRYASENPHWEIVTPYLNTRMERVAQHPDRYDGIITSIHAAGEMNHALTLGLPLVEVANTLMGDQVPCVFSDEAAIGRMAASHLLEKGFVHFAYCGFSDHKYSQDRAAAFQRALERRGYRLDALWHGTWEDSLSSAEIIDEIKRWIGGLPRPVGIFCCSDIRSLHVYQAIRQCKLAIPGEVALLGVDNEKDLVGLYGLELSSIEQNVECIGYESARLLDRLMHGHKPPGEPVLISPLSVVARSSTDIHHNEDELIRRALELIQSNALQPFTVKDLVVAMAISRRALERRFKQVAGCTPSEAIAKVRLSHARELLLNTDMTMREISEKLGFPEQRQLTRIFRSYLKTTPLKFRQQNRWNRE